MAELDLEHGQDDDDVDDAKPTGRGRRGRPSTAQVSGDLKRTISEGLAELAEWLDGRDHELAVKLRDGAPKMADFLAHHAGKRARVARVIRFVFAKGGPFAFLRSFGPTTRVALDRLGAWRERRADEIELEPDAEHDDGPPA